MLRRKVLDPADLASPPTLAEVVPYLWKGAVLAFRMIVTFGEETNLLQQPAVHGRIGQLMDGLPDERSWSQLTFSWGCSYARAFKQ